MLALKKGARPWKQRHGGAKRKREVREAAAGGE
jgi:hypothetical protein